MIKIHRLFAHKKKWAPQTPPTECQWSIGIYEGVSPFTLQPPDKITNPIISPCDVSDAKARLVADPFGVRCEGRYYLFFEAEVKTNNGFKGKIAMASSENGQTWQYEKVVLSEPFHLSYPYVFTHENQFYLIPESRQYRQVRLYRAVSFPFHWELDTILLKGKRFADNTLFFYNNMWWLFTDSGNSTLRLYFSPHLKGPYKQHRKSPIRKKDPHYARPAGRVILYKTNPVRFAQDTLPIYGSKVWGFRVITLTTEDYQEEPITDPILDASGAGWNSHGMHTVDATQLPDGSWRAYVDGYGSIKAGV
ncbi:MAG: hypothetical protein CSA25_00915 [Desulfobacter postgatei]|uniref:Glucosamine inositolphosphorylceramide transferase 1 N-terminal domain-containing protein n=1 Tax=Desulfobacter postgatei TaxID=2293 RepID=A0A2G6MT91_9BACT|nr:MAG: hypothetical protein CSA25_00915 [Desulfobacter postgatei]